MCNRGKGTTAGMTFAALGAGLLIGTVFPSKVVILLLGAALVICGISCGKR